MPSHKIDRINEDVHRELCAILRTIKDPRVSQLLSVVRVEVTRDLSYATVYVSAMEGMEKTKESVKGLKSAAGYIRRELGRSLSMRSVPELRFVADDSIAYSAEINRILNTFEFKDESDEEEAE